MAQDLDQDDIDDIGRLLRAAFSFTTRQPLPIEILLLCVELDILTAAAKAVGRPPAAQLKQRHGLRTPKSPRETTPAQG